MSPHEIELAEMPAWLVEKAKLQPASLPEASGSALTRLLNNPPVQGYRHDWLTSVAGCYASATPDFTQYAAQVRVANAALTSPLPDAEVEGIVRGIWAKEKAKEEEPAPWESPLPFDSFDLPAFPTEAMPPVLRNYVRAEAVAIQTPEDLPGVVALCTVSLSIADKIRVSPQPGWTEPTNLYALVSLPPANRKSVAFEDVYAPLVRYEEHLLEKARPEIAHIENEREILKKRIKDAQKEASLAEDDKERLNLTLTAELLVDEQGADAGAGEHV
ncbi:MAG: DUF3987 domain-containing protein, partial [Armatimonadota bacterium]